MACLSVYPNVKSGILALKPRCAEIDVDVLEQARGKNDSKLTLTLTVKDPESAVREPHILKDPNGIEQMFRFYTIVRVIIVQVMWITKAR